MTELSDVNIRHLKLSTGEEIIAIVLDQHELSEKNRAQGLMILQRPMKIRTVETETTVSFLFYEWQPLANNDICHVNPMHVVSHVECDNSVKGQYINVCVNGGQQPPAGPSDSEYDLDSELDSLLIEPTDQSNTYH